MRFGPIILVWCMVIGAAFAVFMSFLSGIGGSYHQNADGAHLQAFYGMFWMVLLCALLFLAFLIMSKRDQWSVWVQVGVLAVFAAGAFGVERAYVTLNPQPTHFLMSLDGTYYGVPRAYSPRVKRERIAVGQIEMSVCVATLAPQYDAPCKAVKDAPRTAIVALSNRPITSSYWVSDMLSKLDVHYEGNTVGPLPEGVGRVENGVMVLEADGAVLMLELNEPREIERIVWCRKGVQGCHGFRKTEYGILSFPSVGAAVVDTARWDAEEARVAALFDGWRCTERTCDGLFEGGATVGFADG